MQCVLARPDSVTMTVETSTNKCAFYEFNGVKLTFYLFSFVKRIQNDVRDDVMHDEK